MTPAQIDQIALMLIAGAAVADIRQAAIGKMGALPDDADKAIAEARRKIVVAADYNRDEQIAIAFARLNALYGASASIDPKTALAAQREINKLLSLYTGPATPATGGDSSEAAKALELVRAHLEPLELAPAAYPIAEHARLAAAIVRNAARPKRST